GIIDSFTFRMQKGFPRRDVHGMAVYDDSIKVEDNAGKHSPLMHLDRPTGVELIRARIAEHLGNLRVCRYPAGTQKFYMRPCCRPSWEARQSPGRRAVEPGDNRKDPARRSSRPKRPNCWHDAQAS